MADLNTPAPDEPINSFSSPAWLFERDDDVRLAPPPEKFFSDLAKVKPAKSEGPKVAMPASAIVPDPDTITSPADALDQARKRIAAMRASLQLNLNQVAQSFNHPIFTTVPEGPQIGTSNSSVETVPPSDFLVDKTETAVNDPVEVEIHQTEISIDEVSASQLTSDRVFIPTDTQQQPEAQVAQPNSEHSLELMIMRDEIKDLRERLDASQKLIEELMHRLANLAELALRR